MPFEEWLSGLARLRRRRWTFDNHIRPMCEMVPETAVVFRLEDGWDPVIDWLQGFCAEGSVLPRKMPERNVLERRLAHEARAAKPVNVSDNSLKLLERMYFNDLRKFKY